jgi:phage tail tape-measure protein
MFVMAAAAAVLLAGTVAADAQRSTTGTIGGAAAGAAVGSIAGPPGMIVGGIVGAGVGNQVGPRDTYARGKRVCWRDMQGVRHCRWR